MTPSQGTPAPSDAALARVVQDLRGEVAEPASVEEAVARIRVWRSALQVISAVAEAQVMAACWVMRRQSRDREAFGRLVDDRLRGVLSLDRALAMAKTWEVARRQRALRSLAMSDPGDAILFVRDFAEAVPRDLDELDEDDQQVAALLAAPPRVRRARLREMIQGRLELAGGAPRTSSPAPAPGPAGPGPASLVARVKELEGALADLARDAARVHWGKAHRDVFLRTVERGRVHLDNCCCVDVDGDDGDE